ncbi:hypothetical protein ACIPW9_26800 [Streptomyces sp. NPDC090052]|uniref:DUF7144 family membrane protein n=1 Tax=unclassified Streptomyces TaxID=2593676 RepID=UPI002E216115|nr:hypothetical protein OG372_19135 [Streptomyces sp. NBC_01020]WSX68408.1 hypothetical protein OG221_18220 [Streptomyces sp. NBC_00932]
MAQSAAPSGGPTPHHTQPGRGSGSAWASGGTLFAGVLLFVDGVLGVLNGVVGIAKDSVYTRVGHYAYEFNLTAWGWIHLAIGVLLILTGLGILRGAPWARWLGVFMAGISVIANFMWLPYQPIWAFIAIAIGVFVIWSLLTDHHVRAPGR